jgi:cytochrome c
MFTPSRISPVLEVGLLGLALCLAASAASADGPGLGKPVTEAEIAAWDISIEPNGKGLPAGAGAPAQGAHIYVEKCAACHGPEGKAGVTGVTAAPLPPLVGGDPITDISAATKRIANFWPHPMTLANDEVYALTAYILTQNKLIGENDTMNAETLPTVHMPNRDGFIIRFPEAL